MKIRTKSRKLVLNNTRTKLPESYPWQIAGWLASDLSDFLTESENIKISQIIRNRDLEGYLALSKEWGLQCVLPTDSDIVGIRARYQVASLLKKYQFSTEQSDRRLTAKNKFLAYENRCSAYNHCGYSEFSWASTSWGVRVFTYARSFLRKLLGDSLPSSGLLTEWSRHGPGSTIGTKKGFISSYHKYKEWPYSCTLDCYRWARFSIETDQRWFGALQNSYRERFKIPKHFPLDMKLFWTRVIRIVEGNRITFVPKDARTERTIAIEPLLNLFLQLGVDGYIRRRLRRFGVNLDDQSKNQELARRGSIDGSFSTIDLEGASDSVSLKLCELLLPPDWFSYLRDLRSPKGDLGGETISYEKISSMGNGYTFALESAIFTAIIFAVYKADRTALNLKRFAVFGDDLVIETEKFFKVVEALRLSGFSINNEKSFNCGFIRESCGTDWSRGHSIRPIFLDDAPVDVMGLFVDYNRLKRNLDLYWSLEESKTLSCMYRWIPEFFRKFTGPYSDESFDGYIHSRLPFSRQQHGMWRYQRIVIDPIPQKGNEFLFRKLMHDLRNSDAQPLVNKWERKSEGSRFTVIRRNFMTASRAYSRTSIWCDEYNVYMPPTI